MKKQKEKITEMKDIVEMDRLFLAVKAINDMVRSDSHAINKQMGGPSLPTEWTDSDREYFVDQTLAIVIDRAKDAIRNANRVLEATRQLRVSLRPNGPIMSDFPRNDQGLRDYIREIKKYLADSHGPTYGSGRLDMAEEIEEYFLSLDHI